MRFQHEPPATCDIQLIGLPHLIDLVSYENRAILDKRYKEQQSTRPILVVTIQK